MPYDGENPYLDPSSPYHHHHNKRGLKTRRNRVAHAIDVRERQRLAANAIRGRREWLEGEPPGQRRWYRLWTKKKGDRD